MTHAHDMTITCAMTRRTKNSVNVNLEITPEEKAQLDSTGHLLIDDQSRGRIEFWNFPNEDPSLKTTGWIDIQRPGSLIENAVKKLNP